MKQRIMVSVPAILLFFAALWLLDWFYTIVIAIVALIAEYEMINSTRQIGIKVFEMQLYVFATLLIPAYALFGLFGALLILVSALTGMLIQMAFTKENRLVSFVYSIGLWLYPQFNFLFLTALINTPDPWMARTRMLITFGAALLADTFAYFIGRAFGKHPLAPSVSPKKTIEGAIGGFFGGMIFCIGIGFLANRVFNMGIPYYHFMILGAILPVLSQMGDLVASALKRDCGIKDYGSIMPGHGGVMDRLDSVLFIAPIAYLYFFMFI